MVFPRRAPYSYKKMNRLVNPESIAVVGASTRAGAFGNRTLRNLARYSKKVFAVNPKHTEMLGRPCYPDIESLPVVPDCAILAIPKEQVIGLVERCGRLGVAAVIVYASGFSETGRDEDRTMQERLAALAREYDMCVVGPNCVGIVNVGLQAGMHFMPDFDTLDLRAGKTAIVSQSGAIGFAFLQAMKKGAGFSHLLAAGNASDVDMADYINFLAEDPATQTAICVLEGVQDGRKLLQACRHFRDAGKTLVVYKTGRGKVSEAVALSHTGTMVGSHDAYITAFNDAGAICVDDLDEALCTATFFAKVDSSRGPQQGVGIMATSGGAAVIAADKAEAHGVALTPLRPETLDRLAQYVPDFGTVGNPTDTTAQVLANPEHFASCIEAFLDDPGIDALVVPMIFLSTPETERRVSVLSEIAARYDKPVCVVWMSTWKEGPGVVNAERDERLVSFFSADHCFLTLKRYLGRTTPMLPTGQDAHQTDVVLDANAIRPLLNSEHAALTERESKQVLAAAGIPVTREVLVQDVGAAERAAAEMGYPVALKVESPDILHKTEVGVIRLNIADTVALRQAYDEVLSAARQNAPHATIRGVLVQRMVPDGVELALGVVNDVQFGPLMTVGLGGVMVELLQDIQCRLAPLTHDQARDMIFSLRGAALLQGFRGRPAVNIDAIADSLVRLSVVANRYAQHIEEIDVNPIVADEHGVVVVDALIVTTREEHPGDTATVVTTCPEISQLEKQ